MIATSNTMIAKIFAALAVAGLVVSSFAAFAPANAQTTTTTTASGSSTASITFTNDLTIGSTGAAVTALQTYLIAKGHAIAAGATGYFGMQTKAALASYQSANGISPAVGYFGPITRAKVNGDSSTGGSTGGTGSGSGTGSTGGLSGGEADLSDFDLRREESQGNEGESEVEVFTAEFDVEDGDIRIERMEIMASSTDDSLSGKPWDYFDAVYVYVDGKEVADMDVDSRSDWDEENGSGEDRHSLTLSGLDIVVDEGDRAEITVAFDISDSIDTDDLDQDFVFWIEDEGIRGTDSEGIQQYIGEGDGSENVTFSFGAEENGDLSIKSSSEDPAASILVADADNESEEYTVFMFEIENDQDVESLITDLTVDVTVGSGDADDVIRRATLVIDGDEFDGDVNASDITFEDIDFEVGGDETYEAELMITLVRDAAATTLVFDVSGSADVDAEGLDSGDSITVSGSADSETHTIALTGIAVEPVSTSQSVVTPGSSASASYGTFTIKFDVTALEEDAYIATTTDNATAGFEGVVYRVMQDGTASTTLAGSAVLTSTADKTAGFFVVDEGDTETFTLTVTVDPTAAGTYEVQLGTISFNDGAEYTGETVFTIDANDDDYQTDPVYIAN